LLVTWNATVDRFEKHSVVVGLKVNLLLLIHWSESYRRGTLVVERDRGFPERDSETVSTDMKVAISGIRLHPLIESSYCLPAFLANKECGEIRSGF
jgi:hypothetical protein